MSAHANWHPTRLTVTCILGKRVFRNSVYLRLYLDVPLWPMSWTFHVLRDNTVACHGKLGPKEKNGARKQQHTRHTTARRLAMQTLRGSLVARLATFAVVCAKLNV